jgi:NADPH-dependent curcumin reductase CurA
VGPGPGPATDLPRSTGPTGHPVVDAALEQLEHSAQLPAAEQVSAYEATHRALQQTLGTIDQA